MKRKDKHEMEMIAFEGVNNKKVLRVKSTMKRLLFNNG